MDRNPNTKINLSLWEEELVDRAQRGDRVAFALLVDMHRPAVVGQAMRMLRDSEDAQDAVQETFLKACKAINSFHKGRPMLPWLLRICSNCSVDIIRARRTPVESLDSHEHALYDQNADVESDLETSLGSQSLREAIVRLPMRYREIVVMRHYRHMDVNEIATALGKPEGTIKSWLFRARALLKKDLTTALAS